MYKIYRVDRNTRKIKDWITIKGDDFIHQDLQVEGATFYKGRFYIVSEDLPIIYNIDTSTWIANKVNIDILKLRPIGMDGMEGIAANEQNEKLYILYERKCTDMKCEAYIFTCAINGPDQLSIIRIDTLPLANSKWRYSDIYYDSTKDRHRLLCLKSKPGDYSIDSMKVGSNGIPDLKTFGTLSLISKKLNDTANYYYKEDYSNNLEGITADTEGNMYVVSDNKMGPTDCSKKAVKANGKDSKTLLLKINKIDQ
jgi:hypothetical protein